MICEKCRAQLPDGSIYCKHCGHLIVADAPGLIIRPDSSCVQEPAEQPKAEGIPPTQPMKVPPIQPAQNKPVPPIQPADSGKPGKPEAVAGKKPERKKARRKKKSAAPVVIVLLILALIGVAVGYTVYCQEAKDVMAAIDAIGTVTLESEDDILDAEEMYDALSEHKQGMVENYDTLVEARSYFDEISAALKEAREAMLACEGVTSFDDEGNPTVQEDSKWVVDKAREAYDNLGQYGLTEEAADLLPKLEMAEKGYINQHTSDLWIEAYFLEEDGKFQEALDKYLYITENYSGYPMEDNVHFGISECYAGLGDEKYAQGSYAEALELYKKGLEYFDHYDCGTGAMNCVVRDLETQLPTKQYTRILAELEEAKELYGAGGEYFSFRDKVEKEQKKNTPANGRIFANKLSWGYCKLVVKAGNQDAYIKLESSTDPSKYVTFFVRKNESATVSVGDGEYVIKYAVGDDWVSEAELFGDSTSYTKGDKTITFATTYSGGYVHYSRTTVTLHKTTGGTFSTSDLDPDDF